MAWRLFSFRLWFCTGVLVVVFGTPACAEYYDAELLDVEGIEPRWVVPTRAVHIHGDGFPLGLHATVVFDGTFLSPGRPPEHTRVVLQGESTSAREVRIRNTAGLLRSLGDRGTFVGSLRVEFAGVSPGARVFGENVDVTFHVRARSVGQSVQRLEEQARSFLTETGLAISPQDELGRGMIVDSVGESARSAGFVPGDRIVAIDGMLVDAIQDFAPSPTRSSVVFETVRVAGESPLKIRVNRFDGRPVISWTRKTPFRVALVLLVVVVLLSVTPVSRLTDFCAGLVVSSLRERSKHGHVSYHWLLLACGMILVLSFPIFDAFYAGAATFVMLFVLVLSRIGSLSVSRVPRLAANVRPGLSQASFSSRAVIHRDRFRSGAQDVLRWGLFRGGPAVLFLSGVFVLYGGASMGGAPTFPWQWSAFRSPVALLSFVGFFFVTLVDDRISVRGSVPEYVYRLLAAALAALLFLGGWSFPDLGLAADLSRGFGVVLFLIKTYGLLFLAGKLSYSWSITGTRFCVLFSFAVISVLLSLRIVDWFDLLFLESVTAPVLLILTTCFVVYVAIRFRSLKPRFYHHLL